MFKNILWNIANITKNIKNHLANLTLWLKIALNSMIILFKIFNIYKTKLYLILLIKRFTFK